MALKYRVVLKKDMSKNAEAGSRLYYGQVRSIEKTEFKKLCELVSGHCTATKGEVELVIDGLMYVVREQLETGNVVQMGGFGNFRLLAGSKGAKTLKDFDTALFKKGRIVFTPGAMLKEITLKPSFLCIDNLVPQKNDGESDGDKPSEL